MSNLIRELLARLNEYAIPDDFVDQRSISDVQEEAEGVPLHPTAMKQLQAKSQGYSPTPFTTKIQLDR